MCCVVHWVITDLFKLFCAEFVMRFNDVNCAIHTLIQEYVTCASLYSISNCLVL